VSQFSVPTFLHYKSECIAGQCHIGCGEGVEELGNLLHHVRCVVKQGTISFMGHSSRSFQTGYKVAEREMECGCVWL